jgi:hypothetical protein
LTLYEKMTRCGVGRVDVGLGWALEKGTVTVWKMMEPSSKGYTIKIRYEVQAITVHQIVRERVRVYRKK